MDEGPITHPGVPQDVYHTLGNKTLSLFMLQRVGAALVLFFVAVILLIAGTQSSLQVTPLGDIRHFATIGGEVCAALFLIAAAITLLMGWLVYNNYRFSLGDDSLKIKRGIFEKEEVAIPYRQIQDVDIDRDLSFQLLGLSRIVILTAGHEEEKSVDGEDESEGILPAIDKDLAEWLQAELLKRANIQKIAEESGGR